MGRILFFFGSVVILGSSLVKECETVQVSRSQEDCRNVTCPENCDCIGSSVSCENRSLTYIPRIPDGITYLNLSKCNISTLSINDTMNLMCSFETLTHMSLRDCKITLYVGDVFTNLTKLEVLDLSLNKIASNKNENFRSIQKALGSLNNAPLRILKLDHILVQSGEIFKYFEGRNLTHLSMRSNQMQDFDVKMLENFTKLTHLDLHGNWINKIDLRSGIQTLELLNLSHNQINIFPPNFCNNQTPGETHYNNLKNLDLSWNQIILPYSQNWNCLKSLETLNLSRNDMEDITNGSFKGLSSLKTLILSEMRFSLKRIRNEALQSDSLQVLDLSGNGLNFHSPKEVDGNVFDYLPNLTSLDVSDNDLGNDGDTLLTNLSGLETLIMSHVYLRHLPDFLGHFRNLNYLDLSMNKIEQFSAEAFQNVRTLKFLNMSDNLISNFPVPPFPSATLTGLKTLDFSYNYFICDCEIFKLKNWINDVLSDPNKTNLISGYPGQYWCYKPKNLHHVLLKDAVPSHCNNNKYQLILSVVSSVSICLVFTVVLVVGFIYRWEIKLFLHKMRHHKKHDGYHSLSYTFEYSTYVVYAEKDSAWVIHDLLKDLEEARYNVYIKDRYSVPGVARCDEIVDNMYKSKTVILVLSKNFTSCQWCIYQLNVAQERAVKLGPRFIIPVLLEGIDSKHMKKSVQHLFRTSKPIEWARQRTKKQAFLVRTDDCSECRIER